MWALEIEEGKVSRPIRTECVLDCSLPLQYGLPCKCWLYQCIAEDVHIPISLIHPRWLFDGPEYVSQWRMTFNLEFDISMYERALTANDLEAQIPNAQTTDTLYLETVSDQY